jgi:hypothetical protein
MPICVVHQDVNGAPCRCLSVGISRVLWILELTAERSNCQSIAWCKQILRLAAQGENVIIDDANMLNCRTSCDAKALRTSYF